MACSSQELIEDAACVFEFISPGLQPYALLAILCAIRDSNTSMACDAQSVINEAACLQHCIPDGMVFPALISVACAIAQAGGGGGGGGCANLDGAGSPVGSVTPDCIGQFYSDTTGDFLWQARGLTDADWHLWV